MIPIPRRTADIQTLLGVDRNQSYYKFEHAWRTQCERLTALTEEQLRAHLRKAYKDAHGAPTPQCYAFAEHAFPEIWSLLHPEPAPAR